MDRQIAGSPNQSQIMTFSFARAMALLSSRIGQRSFVDLDRDERLEVVRWTVAISKTPAHVRERGNCLRVRATYSHSHRIRYYECACGVRYYAEVIPSSYAPGPREVILEAHCPACREEAALDVDTLT